MKLKPNLINKEDGFIVQTLYVIFYILERVSLFYLVRNIAKKISKSERPLVSTPMFPEVWAVSNTLLAVILVYLIPVINCKWLLILFVVYAILRIMEMFVYQINVLLFHRLANVFQDINEKASASESDSSTESYHIKSSTRTIILLLLNMYEYIVQFAVIFAATESLAACECVHIGILGSFQLFMNVSSLDLTANHSDILFTAVYIETVIGIFVNIICLARFISILPEVREKGYSQK